MRGAGRGETRFVALVGFVALAGCLPVEGDGDVVATREPGAVAPARPAADESTPAVATAAAGGPALRLLDTLAVKGRAPKTGYAREQFGRAWTDTDHNGCDTRDDILRRDLREVTFKPGARECVVLSGVLDDPYTGEQIHFEHGVTSIDIDHVVALSDAWVKGAAHWQPGKRLALANDPLNLLAVDSSANRAKGDGDAATWLPPARGYRCKYVARQIAVKAKYALSLTAAERDAMQQILRACPDEPAPVGDHPISATPPRGESKVATKAGPAPVDVPIPSTASRDGSKVAPGTGPAPVDVPIPSTASRDGSKVAPGAAPPTPARKAGVDPNYGTCKQARAHGAGPYQRDRDPEYHYYQDRDGDGVVCE